MARWLIVLLALVFTGCAVKPVAPDNPRLFNDALFKPATERIDASNVLAMSPAMRAYLEHDVAAVLHNREPQRALLDALYAGNQLKLRYDSTMTRTAAEAFEARAGNCLSLVLMTAVFAREMGLQVRYQSVHTDPSWGRYGDLYFSIGHINLAVGRPLAKRSFPDSADWVTIDFLPGQDLRGQRFVPIEESTLLAMYMNNKAAEALSAGAVDDAYWWVRGAIAQDRQLLIAYNTLGVVYQRHGDAMQAEQALRFALTLEPANVQVIGNLAQLLTAQGRNAEAQPLRETLARLQPDPPFKYFNLGRAAMQQGDFSRARDLFERELERDPDYHEFHFWLALANLKLGDLEKARSHLVRAQENSNTQNEAALYSAKLARLNSGHL